jgi:CRP/FNR family transcriptional regulator, cyclic AMP receptor protein
MADEPLALPASLPGPLGDLFATGRRISLKAGSVLFTEGDATSRVVLLVSGRIKASTLSIEGIETILGFRGPGEVLGELSAMDGEPHVATVTVVEDGEALTLPTSRFLEAIDDDPAIARAMLRTVVTRLREADRRRAEFVVLDVTGRVAQRLVELATTTGVPEEEGIRIGIPLSQRELAGWVGASREAVNKALALLEEMGLVSTARRRLVVKDVDALRRRAG